MIFPIARLRLLPRLLQLTLKVVEASAIVEVDPSKVNRGISAQIAPPSLMGKTEQANTGTN